MKRTVGTAIAATAVLLFNVGSTGGANATTDEFDRTELGANWITAGGGNLHIAEGRLSADGTPSEPVSMAFHAVPAAGETQEVQATIRWNGRNPEHSAMSIALRADPATQHAGVHFWFTATSMGLSLLSWDGTTFTPAAGTDKYIPVWFKWPDGTTVRLRAEGDTYAAYLGDSPHPVLSGTFTEEQVPHTNRYGGVHGQDDSEAPGGGEPPAVLDDFRFSTPAND